MKATAVVKKVHANGSALIEVVRKSACAGDCGTCHGCAHPEEHVRVTARNPLAAQAGDRVTVESATGAVLGWASLLYILPVVLMLAGALLPVSGEKMSILFSLGGLFLGLLICFAVTRKSKTMRSLTFTITEVLPGDNLHSRRRP